MKYLISNERSSVVAEGDSPQEALTNFLEMSHSGLKILWQDGWNPSRWNVSNHWSFTVEPLEPAPAPVTTSAAKSARMKKVKQPA